MSAPQDSETIWTWAEAERRRPDHVHARWVRGDLVLIVHGGANGSVPIGQGGVRLPRQVAAALGQFLTGPEIAAARVAAPHADLSPEMRARLYVDRDEGR